MTFPLSPRWGLAAQAIDGAGDPHLKAGVHLKILPSHHLGLPITPYIVYRYRLGVADQLGGTRSDITWIDSRGQTLHTPFNVTTDNPVTGYLPIGNGEVCCWLDVDATPARVPRPFPDPRRPPVVRGRVALQPRVVEALRGREAELARAREGEVARTHVADVRAADLLEVIRWRASLRVDATVATSRGMAVVASSLGPNYQLAYTPIQQIRISGAGRVDGIRWLDARRLKQISEPWRLLALPVSSGHRYAGIPDAEARAKERIERGAPVRLGLHDQPDAANPAACAAATDADETARLDAGRAVLAGWLDRLLNDMSAEPAELRAPVDFSPGPTSGTLQVPCLGALLQASLDPGVGRWLGYGDRDEAPPGAAGDVIVYWIRALFAFDKDHLGPLAGQVKPFKLADALRNLGSARELGFELDGRNLQIHDDVLDLGTVVCATLGNPPAHLGAPGLATPYSPLATPPSTVGPEAWLPRTPPDAARELLLPMSHLGPGACVALARRTAAGIAGLNRKTPNGRAITLVSTASPSATTPGEMIYRDRAAPPESFFYRAAQADWFGRWSGWSENSAAAGVRPPPPMPTVLATYAQPTSPGPIPLGPLAGTIRVESPVPPPEALTPGAFLLASAQITIGAAVTTVNIPDPAHPPAELVAQLAGPAIERAGIRTVTVTARFVDINGTPSADSPPVTLTCRDPRPPEEITLPLTLLYGSRPDATGLSRITLRWTSAPGQAGYRVFYADELRLGSALDKLIAAGGTRGAQAQTIRTALDAAPDAPSRAAVLTTNRAFFDRAMFEQLTDTPLPNPGPGIALQFDHAVSGSLRVLSIYRIVSVSASQVESPFAASGLSAYAVPNTGAPPQPLLSVVPDPTAPANVYRAKLTISVPRGLVNATEYRVKRSTRKSAAAHEMITVASGTVAPPDPTARPEDPQVTTLIDNGASILGGGGSLRPWTQYHWTVEVRGEAEPGGGPPAAWSTPSAKASILFVPTSPPAQANITGAKVGSDFEVRWTVADKLAGGQVGQYELELYRKKPGEHERRLAVIAADAPAAAGGRGGDITAPYHYVDPAPPVGTSYRVIVRDPAGRTSQPTNAVKVEP